MRLLLLTVLCSVQLSAGRAETSITGRVVGPDGAPAVGARVVAMVVPEKADDTNLEVFDGFGETDAAGRYRLENLQPGRHYIRAGLVDSPTFYPGVPSVTEASVVTVARDSTAEDINFSLLKPFIRPSGVTVSGRVTFDRRQAPLTAPPIILLARGAQDWDQFLLPASGSFEFLKVPPGDYSVAVRGSGAAQRIVVDDKDVRDVELVLPLRVEVRGRVLIEKDKPLPASAGTLALWLWGSRSSTRIAALADGTMKATIPEGEYNVALDSVPGGYFVKSIRGGSTDLLRRPLQVTTPDAIEIQVVLGKTKKE